MQVGILNMNDFDIKWREGKMSNETKRMNYFNGLLLKEEDLTLDQDYHISSNESITDIFTIGE
ncbi:hypothetical protein EHE19_012885 [Ruminiclostridium herbifermentans]|uniref:Uncharacterized protein n=1 Tax=Ruminiclostridium herbifermentans TaxID=2488810 RepID=A0A7H1VK83_9FIRM|nr:hypothetical protein EHE19_012885 [Ruminiclostridium herbifermentans]